MKPQSTTGILALICCATTAFAGNLPLADAVKQKKVTVEVRHFTPGTDSLFQPSYFRKCMAYTVKNLTTAPVTLSEEAGRFFQPEDTGVQRMVLTENLAMVLRPGETREFPVYAMCSEASDSGPGNEIRFRFGNMATGPLKELVAFIAEKGYQNGAGQDAVWVITDNHSPYSIEDADTTMSRNLQQFVCRLKNITWQPNQQRVFHSGPLVRYVEGEFEFTLQRPHRIDLKLYTGQGQLISTLVNNEMKNPGKHAVSYQTNVPLGTSGEAPSLVIRFYLDGELFAERKHVLSN